MNGNRFIAATTALVLSLSLIACEQSKKGEASRVVHTERSLR